MDKFKTLLTALFVGIIVIIVMMFYFLMFTIATTVTDWSGANRFLNEQRIQQGIAVYREAERICGKDNVIEDCPKQECRELRFRCRDYQKLWPI